jgi:hypothetical protein
MTIKVLADFHHEALYYSLHLLFEKRLGFELYRQIGKEWYDEGYWMVRNHPDAVNQYLGIHLTQEWEDIKKRNAGMYCTMPNENAVALGDGMYLLPDYARSAVYKAVTLDKFKNIKFDIVISSIPTHIDRFNKLISLYQPQAKHIFQVGNNWSVGGFNVKNILTSSKQANPAAHQHSIFYHQEFDLNDYCRVPCPNPQSVLNMMHFMQGDCLMQFNQGKMLMPGWKWSAHGGGNADGPIATENMSQAFKDHGFVWHYKREGDGFGYNAMNALACGRPVITRKSFFKGMTLDPLLIDGKTCIDIDIHGLYGAVKMLNKAAADHEAWSVNSYNHFKSIVDYDREAEDIRVFLQNLR